MSISVNNLPFASFTQLAFSDLYKIRKIFERCFSNPASIVAPPRWGLLFFVSAAPTCEPRPNSHALCSQESSVYLSVYISIRYTDGNSQPWPLLTRQPSMAVCVRVCMSVCVGRWWGERGSQHDLFTDTMRAGSSRSSKGSYHHHQMLLYF